jgi:hypothetical protein
MPNQSLFENNSSDFELPDRSTPIERNSPVDSTDPNDNETPTNATDPIELDEPIYADDTGEVFDLGMFETDASGVITEDLSSSSPIDVYQFTVEEGTDFSFVLDGLSADADLYVLDENYELIGASENYDLESEGLEGTLTDGTYFLGVVSYDDIATDYDLTYLLVSSLCRRYEQIQVQILPDSHQDQH